MVKVIPGPAYRIETDRLVIRCHQPADAELLKDAIDQNLDHLRPWMTWAHAEPSDLQTIIERIRRFRGLFDLNQDFHYGLFNLAETQIVGGSGLHIRAGHDAREIGYWIHKDHLNRGLATEVAAALTKVAFEIDQVDRVEIQCGPANVRSAAIPKKLGFVHEATLRRRFETAEGWLRDTMIWSLFTDTYPHSLAAQANIRAYDAAGRQII